MSSADWKAAFQYATAKKIKQEYPQLAFMLNVREVAPLLNKLVREDISPQLFKTKLYRTQWWKKHGDTNRQFMMRKALDPGSVKQDMDTRTLEIRRMAQQLGVKFRWTKQTRRQQNKKFRSRGAGRVFKGKREPSRQIAELSLRLDWSEDQILEYIMGFAQFNDEGAAQLGGIGAAMTDISSIAKEFMLDPNQKTLFKDAKKLLTGKETQETLMQKYRMQAKGKFGDNQTIIDLLDNGGSMNEFFSPYRELIAQELEILPDQVDLLNDQRFTPVTGTADENGTLRPMTISEASAHIRNLSDWGSTRRAEQEWAEVQNTLLTSFGRR